MKLLAVATAIFGLSVSAASADLMINPNGNAGGVQATPETALNGGPGFPLTAFGYTSSASLVANTAGLYRFTFEGAGNAGDTNDFTSTGGSFNAVGPGATGAGSSPNGASFTEFLTAGQVVPFTLTASSAAGALDCTISGGGVAAPTGGCDYLIALGSSSTAPGALGPQGTAWIGFSNSPSPDHDFQDLVVRVDAVPEPASLTLLATSLLGLGLISRKRRRSV